MLEWLRMDYFNYKTKFSQTTYKYSQLNKQEIRKPGLKGFVTRVQKGTRTEGLDHFCIAENSPTHIQAHASEPPEHKCTSGL